MFSNIFHKTCPWCQNKSKVNQLGSRPALPKPKWYQFSRQVKVCPYCAGAVTFGGKGLWFVVLIMPLFFIVLLELFLGLELQALPYVRSITWGLAALGFLLTYLFFELVKVEGQEPE
ncbi:hypothetical protein ACFSJ3_08565 [Corallincola platygyrae]|uniref:DUF983 domain-containing protein n=1 Tax=Corallincola platygyrae TaxID=1193278 RepID=A0ABW4XPS8_9GAMM